MSNIDDATNALEMSDEDFLNSAPTFDDTDTSGSDVDDTDHDETGIKTDSSDEGTDDDATDETATDEDSKDTSDPPDESGGDDPKIDQDVSDTPSKDDDKDIKAATGELTSEQYAEVGRQIMGEFKANGSTMKVKSVEDALQLMQMGANYHKKMIGLKPSLKTLKLLENNGLLDPEKLNYLIDLSQKKPEAIKQLLKESKLDPLTIDMEEENTYKPANRTVSDTEMALDEVLDSISGTTHYDRTLTVLSNEWDDASRRAIASEPELIRVINGHMEHGIFDQVANAVNYERSLGKLTGVSDLEAYQRVGTYMNENNMFQHSTVAQPVNKPTLQDTQPVNNTNTQQEDERKNRKKAASPSRQGPAVAKKDENYSPLSMSDEEFVKLNNLSL